MTKIHSIPRSHKAWKQLIELSSRGNSVSYGTSRCAYILFSEVLELNAKKVIELGAGSGWSAEALLLGLEITGGYLWTVDIRFRESISEKLKARGFKFSFYHGDSLNFVKSWDKGQVEIVFIDTSHTYDQTLKELNAYAPLIKDNGAIFLHDILSQHTYESGRYRVYEAISEWLKLNPEWELYVYYTPYGLGKLKRSG